MTRSGKLLFLFPALIVILLVTFFLMDRLPGKSVNNITENVGPSPTPTPAPEDLKWTSYKNTIMGVEIRYPGDLSVENNGRTSFLITDRGNRQPTGVGSFIYVSYVPDLSTNISPQVYNATTEEITDMLNASVNETINLSSTDELEDWYNYTRLEDIKIGNRTFRSFKNDRPWEFPSGTREIRYLSRENNSVYLAGAYVNEATTLNEILAKEIISTIVFSPPADNPPPVEETDIILPENWETFEDETYGLTVKHPRDWKVTPAPSNGTGGTVKLEGNNNGEVVIAEIGKHQQLKRPQAASLRSIELARSPQTYYEEERNINLNGRDVYQQLIPITQGGTIGKKYGIYNIFELNSGLYFLEVYTDNPLDQFELVSELLASVN